MTISKTHHQLAVELFPYDNFIRQTLLKVFRMYPTKSGSFALFQGHPEVNSIGNKRKWVQNGHKMSG
jgi:hypothetical protein